MCMFLFLFLRLYAVHTGHLNLIFSNIQLLKQLYLSNLYNTEVDKLFFFNMFCAFDVRWEIVLFFFNSNRHIFCNNKLYICVAFQSN